MKTNDKIVFTVCLVLLTIGMIFLGTRQSEALNADALQNLTVDILKVGKADAMILQEGNNVMVLDAGEEDDGLEMVDTMAFKNITAIDVMIITHFDKDHVGGADIILENIPVKKVIIPNYVGTGSDYNEFAAALEKSVADNNTEVIKLTENMTFSFGDAEVLVEPPNSYEIPEGQTEVDNDFSLITTIEHGDNKLVFMGDAEKKLIREWLEKGNADECDFLKVPHHGVYQTAMSELFDITRPRYAVICTSDKHPAEGGTLELLNKYKTQIAETRNGNITVTSDGISIKMKQAS